MTNQLRRLAIASVLVSLAACSADDALRPPMATGALEAARATTTNESSKVTASDTGYAALVVGPGGGMYVFGQHQINFPANSICDMSQTRYADWGSPCTPISSHITIDVKWWTDAAGHPVVDFAPALRFQATRKGEVTLYLKDAVAAKSANPVIGYCAVVDGPCVDESLTDTALTTKKDSRGGFVYRIIRHFSGYNVWA